VTQQPRTTPKQKRDTLSLWLFVFLLAVYLFTFRGYYGGDHFYSYMTAESLVLHHSFALSDELSPVSDLAYRQAQYLTHPAIGPNGNKYSFYGYGMAMAMAVFYYIGHLASKLVPFLPHDYMTMASVSCLNAIMTALTGTLFYGYCCQYYKRSISLALAVLYAFGTMAWNNAQYGYAEPLNLLLLLTALYALKLWQKGSYSSLWNGALIGGSLGLALLTEVYSAAIVAACIGLYMLTLLIRKREMKRGWLSLLMAALAGLPSVTFLLATNMMRYGHLLSMGRLYGDLRITWIPFALYGFLFSSGKSLFLYCPVLIFSLWRLKQFIYKHKSDAILFGGIAICSILPIATWINYWNGDLAWGPRFLFHLVPLLLLPAGEILGAWWQNHRWRIWLVSGLALWVNLGSILVNQGRYVAAMNAHDLTERLFTPYLSPIVGHWLLIVSRLKTIVTGNSLIVHYPGGPWAGLTGGAIVDLGPFDGFDLWFINIPAQMPSRIIKTVCASGAMALAALAAWSGYRLWRIVSQDIDDGLRQV